MNGDILVVYDRLKEVAKTRSLATYTEVGALIGLDMANEYHRIRIAQILDDINAFEDRDGRPMISAVVVYKDTDRPDPGFFDCARKLEKFKGGSEEDFWVKEVKRVHEWKYR